MCEASEGSDGDVSVRRNVKRERERGVQAQAWTYVSIGLAPLRFRSQCIDMMSRAQASTATKRLANEVRVLG